MTVNLLIYSLVYLLLDNWTWLSIETNVVSVIMICRVKIDIQMQTISKGLYKWITFKNKLWNNIFYTVERKGYFGTRFGQLNTVLFTTGAKSQ